MGILDELEQEETPPSTTSGPTNADVIKAVNAQTKATNGMKPYLTEMVRNEIREALANPPSTSSHSGITPQQIDGVTSRLAEIEHRQTEIERTLGEFAKSLDGERLNKAARTLTATANRQAADSTTASGRVAAEAEKVATELSGLRTQVQQISHVVDVERQARDAAQLLAEPLDRAKDLAGHMDRLSSWSWALGGRLLAGGVLLLVSLAVITGVLSGFSQLIGVPEIAAAIWAAFEATDSWWGQTLWALAGGVFAGAVAFGAWRLTGWLLEYFH